MSRLYKKRGVVFTQAPNGIVQDNALSFKARGLWVYLESKPNNWNFALSRIAKDSTDGIDSVRNGIKELEAVGLLRREKAYVDGKFDGYDYFIELEKNPSLENSSSEKPSLENPTTENPTTYKEREKNKDVKINNDVVVTPEEKPEVPAFIQQQQHEFIEQVNQSKLFPKLNKKETFDILRTDLDLINQVLREFKKSNIKTDSFCLTNNDIYKCTENFKSWYEEMIEDCITKAHNKNEYPKKLGDTKMHVINFLRYQDFAKLKVQLTPKETINHQVYDRKYD